jgi:RNA recognition motif-containing protein
LKYRWEKTVYVSNIPYDLRWTDLKDLFRDKVGDVVYCEVFEKDGRSMGVATLEFRTVSDAERAIEVMHQYELGGRRISVRMDNEGYKTKQAKEMSDLPQSSNSKHSSSRHDDSSSSHTNSINNASLGIQSLGANANPLLSLLCSNPLLASSLGTSNLLSSASSSTLSNQNVLLNQIATQLTVEGPVTNRIFIASLDYKVDENKLKEVYSLAGTVQSVSLFRDRDGRSRGMAVVEYENPFEALNAVSMFNHQQLLDRQMTVRFDTKPPEENSKSSQSSSQAKLPSGLKSIGTGLNLNSLLTTNVPAVNQLSLGALTSLTGIQNQSTTTTPDFAALASNFGLTLNGTGN